MSMFLAFCFLVFVVAAPVLFIMYVMTRLGLRFKTLANDYSEQRELQRTIVNAEFQYKNTFGRIQK